MLQRSEARAMVAERGLSRYQRKDHVKLVVFTESILEVSDEVGRIDRGSSTGDETMDGFEWSPTFEIGVPEIDDDHRHLFDLAQEIQAAVEEGEPAKCRALVEGFIEASQSHFAAEERFLTRIHYEEFETHKRYHASLLTKARKLKQSCDEATRRGEVTTCYLEVVGFLIDDILRGDIKLKSYFNHHGPSRQR